jgi:hypothetical protein
MDKKEFLEKKNAIEKEIADLCNKNNELCQEYIESNQPFPIGSKVKVTMLENVPLGEREEIVYGVVKGYKISVDNEVRPVLSKVNKDGTAHKTAQAYVQWRRHPIVELVD